jgi:hypothetical protein
VPSAEDRVAIVGRENDVKVGRENDVKVGRENDVKVGRENDVKKDELLQVLRDTRAFLARPDNNFAWSSWRNAQAALQEIDGLIERVSLGAADPQELRVLFAPTGPIQEVSSSSGWGDTFLELAGRFDHAVR